MSDYLNILELSPDELKELEKDRAEIIKRDTNGMVRESTSDNPVELDLRFNHGFVHIQPFLYNFEDGVKFELSFEEDIKRIHLSFIGVNEEMRRNGTGTKAIKILAESGKKYGYHDILLEIDTRFGVGKRALNTFYKKLGFTNFPPFPNSRLLPLK
jgi:GNAT superfamily N-acetyltransferase